MSLRAASGASRRRGEGAAEFERVLIPSWRRDHRQRPRREVFRPGYTKGCAVLSQRGCAGARRRLRAACGPDRRLPLANLESGFSGFGAAQAQIAYDEAWVAVDVIMERPAFNWSRLLVSCPNLIDRAGVSTASCSHIRTWKPTSADSDCSSPRISSSPWARHQRLHARRHLRTVAYSGPDERRHHRHAFSPDTDRGGRGSARRDACVRPGGPWRRRHHRGRESSSTAARPPAVRFRAGGREAGLTGTWIGTVAWRIP